jgi:hypothetical protein
VLESVFGRVMPSEPLSLGIFLLSTPNHVLSPAFWHEGVAQWAETAFVSTKPNRLGLGLTLARRDIELLGGSLRFLRNRHGGSLAMVSVPDGAPEGGS